MEPMWRAMTPAEIEAQYNPRVAFPHFQAEHDWRRAASAAAAPRLGPGLEIAYGPGPREAVTLYETPGFENAGDAGRPAPVIAYIHGGAWRSGDRGDYRYLVDGFRALGAAAALVGYPLAPDATMTLMAASVRRAVAALQAHAGERPLLLCGHSAGAHLAALTGDAPGVRGLYLISGLFDLAAVARTTINDTVRLGDHEIVGLDPNGLPAPPVPVRFAVGALETAAFHAESRRLAARHGDAPVLEAAGEDHFTIVRQLADPTSPLSRDLALLLA